jgi:hypothetical protein
MWDVGEQATMVLQLRRMTTLKVRLFSPFLMAIVALIAQPFYGLIVGHVASATTADHIVINEVHPSSDVASRWVELFNPTSKDVNLDGWRITHDSVSGNFGGVLRSDDIIPSHGYFKRIASATGGNSTLKSDGSELHLKMTSDAIDTDTFTYPSLTEGQSYGRSPDGSNVKVIFESQQVTPDASNYYVQPPELDNATSNTLYANKTTFVNGSSFTVSGTVERATTVNLCILPVTAVVTFDSASSCSNAIASDVNNNAWTLEVPATMLHDGETYNFIFTAKDGTGIMSPTVVRKVAVDNTAPVVSISSISPQKPTASTPIAINGLIRDLGDLSSLYIYVDGSKESDNIISSVSPKGTWSYELSDGLSQGNYVISAIATDSVGNASNVSDSPDSAASLSVAAFNPNPKDNLPAVTTTDFKTPASLTNQSPVLETTNPQSSDSTNGNDAGVLGAETTKNDPAKTNSDTAVKGASDTAVIAPSKDGWKILGMPWYLWLLILAVIAGAIYAITRRRSQEA